MQSPIADRGVQRGCTSEPDRNRMGYHVQVEDTYPKLLLRNYRRWGHTRVAMRKKKFGIWRSYTWGDCYQNVKSICLGLVSIGLHPEEKVSIVGDNNPEWFWAEMAIQAGRAIPVGLTVDSSPSDLQYILSHSESKFVIAQDQEQIDKLLKIKDALPSLQRIVYWQPKGLKYYEDPMLMSLRQLMKIGADYESEHPQAFEESVASGRSKDVFMIQYTSGTTGLPKGVCISYEVFFAINEAVRSVNPVYPRDEFVSITLPGWGVEQGFGLLYGLWVGQTYNFAESAETIQRDLREISPQTLLYPSRLWEQQASMIRLKMAEGMVIKRILYNLCLSVGYRCTDIRMDGRRPNLFWRASYALADAIVFKPLRDRIGLRRVRVPYTAGAMLAPDVIRFFHSIGVNLRQIFGSTEGGTTTVHGGDSFDCDSVGAIAPGRCVRIADSGEILVDRARSFSHYHRDPESTDKVLRGAWYYSGDAGHLNDDGQMIFIDRMADMQSLADGTMFSPQYLESRLKFSPYIRDCMVLGGRHRQFVAAVISIDFGNVGHWAEKRRIAYTTFADLSQKRQVYELIAAEVSKINQGIPPASTVRRFANLPKEFDPDEAEMTRTRKLRRAFVEDRYRSLVEAIYGDKESNEMEIPVVYKDGRTALLKTMVRVSKV